MLQDEKAFHLLTFGSRQSHVPRYSGPRNRPMPPAIPGMRHRFASAQAGIRFRDHVAGN
jgi:hypothetical protein